MENTEEKPIVKENSAEATEEAARPVKMRWGRVVDDGMSADEAPKPTAQPRETIPSPSLAEEKPTEVPKEIRKEKPVVRQAPTPRQNPAADAARQAELQKARLRQLQEREAAERAERAREQAERERRRKYAEEHRKREEETERLRQELEQEKLRRKIARRRRGRAVASGILGVFALFFGLFAKIRVTKRVVITLISSLLVALLLAALVGNLLRRRLPSEDEGTTDETTTAETVIYGREFYVPSVKAAIVSLDGATTASLKEAAKRFRATEVDGVSLLLRGSDGELMFDSQTQGGIFGSAGDTEKLSLKEIFKPFRDAGLYVTCLFPMRYMVDGDGYTRDVLYAYEIALLCEIAEAGADEVILSSVDSILVSDSRDVDILEGLSSLREIARAVNLRAPETAVGIALSPEFLLTNESDRYLSEIAEAFDLTLLDLCGLKNSELDLPSTIGAAVTDHLYFILRYGMRVLIPYGTAEGVVNRDVYNWQEGTIGG